MAVREHVDLSVSDIESCSDELIDGQKRDPDVVQIPATA